MKKGTFVVLAAVIIYSGFALPEAGADNDGSHAHGSHQRHMKEMGDKTDDKTGEVPGGETREEMHQKDERTSLGLSPMMKVHQLANMREHLKGVHMIIKGIASGDFEQASKTAHKKLGLTPEMKKNCAMMPSPAFVEMAMAFHHAGDELGDVLLTKDAAKSLSALEGVLARCTSCHDQFRQ